MGSLGTRASSLENHTFQQGTLSGDLPLESSVPLGIFGFSVGRNRKGTREWMASERSKGAPPLPHTCRVVSRAVLVQTQPCGLEVAAPLYRWRN